MHIEAGPHVHRTIEHIRGLGKRAGVVLCPATPAKMLDYLLDMVDLVLVMSVNPGFGGQNFIESQLKKIAAIRKMIDASGRSADLEVDGGIDATHARRCIEAGADALVAGTLGFSRRSGRLRSQYRRVEGRLRDARIAAGIDDGDLPDASERIEEGERLVRIGRDRGLSLGERLAERMQTLTWRTPFHSMRLKGRYPLKLIAVPDDPLIGDFVRGRSLLEGKLCFRGEVRPIETFDPGRADWSGSFDRYFQSFMWLRDLSTVATRVQGAPIAEMLMARWLQVHADRIGGSAWTAENWGKRVLFWTAHAPLILSSTDLIYRSQVLNMLARGRAASGPRGGQNRGGKRADRGVVRRDCVRAFDTRGRNEASAWRGGVDRARW